MMSSPSDRTHRVYGVSFSVANFRARSSETRASFAMAGSAGRRRACAVQVLGNDLRTQLHARLVFGGILDLLEIVQPACLEDAIDDRDHPHRLVPAPA